MNYFISPSSSLSGSIKIPGDKSISHRAIMLGALASGRSHTRGLLMGADNLATLQILRQLGVTITQTGDADWVIDGVGLQGLKGANEALDCGNSGTAMRLLTGLLAAQTFSSTLVGDESLTRRPMARVVNPLREMGAHIEMSSQKTPPLHIHPVAKLTGITYELPVASAQVKSCLLLAGLYANGSTTIVEPAAARDHTERMLQAMGYPITVAGNTIVLQPKGELAPLNLDIPGDISSAAFFIVAATITPGSKVTLQNVGINPTRIGVITILKLMGANISYDHQRDIHGEPVADLLIEASDLQGIEIPIDQVPLAIDEFPVIFIAAACAKGKTVLCGAKELRVKETDRIAAMADGLQRLGINVEVLDDGIIIEGGTLQGGEVESFGDHRIAMSFAIAGIVAQSPVTVRDCANVQTSFPNFVELAKQLGVTVKGE